MPTRTVTVCAACGKPTCDGAMWVWVALRRKDGRVVDLHTIPEENRGPDCSAQYGRANQPLLREKRVGDEVTLSFPNWTPPSLLTLRKVEA